MAVRRTIQIGDPRLKAPNQTIDNVGYPKVKQVILDMIDTMRAGNLIGLAAPQIGENYKIFVTEPRETEVRPKDQSDDLRIYINPELTHLSEEKIEIWEGCGCVAEATLFAPVIRPRVVTVVAIDQEGKKFQMQADGILGRVIQHEYDHLIGIEFVEKISDYSKIMSRDYYIQFIKPLPETSTNSHINIKEYKKL
jgi:peptide deformylase